MKKLVAALAIGMFSPSITVGQTTLSSGQESDVMFDEAIGAELQATAESIRERLSAKLGENHGVVVEVWPMPHRTDYGTSPDLAETPDDLAMVVAPSPAAIMLAPAFVEGTKWVLRIVGPVAIAKLWDMVFGDSPPAAPAGTTIEIGGNDNTVIVDVLGPG